MEPLIAAYRLTSSRVALVALIGGNVVPLVGVLFLGWDVMTILVLYWVENGIVGGLNVLKMLTARGDGPGIGTLAGRIAMTVFFTIHYGIFWGVHGVFVWTVLPSFIGAGLIGPDGRAVALGAIALALSHGASFLFNYLGRGEYLRATVARQMAAPYGRVVILHVTILGGAFVGVFLGTPFGALFVLVLLKIALDAAFHLKEHRSA